jgi:transcriptional antiterminator RfaH
MPKPPTANDLEYAAGATGAAGQAVDAFDKIKSAASDGRWIVLQTRSRQEKAVAADLRALGVGHYLPLVKQVRYYGRRKARVQVPLFPGYVFLHGHRDDAFAADRLKRIATILSVSDQEQIDWELRNIHLALGQSAHLDPHPHLAQGTRVEVRSGPFQGLQGIVENRDRLDRVVLQVNYLNRAMSLEIDAALLELLD